MNELWMAVTPDIYELPIAVARTQKDLCKMLGVSCSTVCKLFRKHESGTYTKWKKYKIVKLEIEEDDNEE